MLKKMKSLLKKTKKTMIELNLCAAPKEKKLEIVEISILYRHVVDGYVEKTGMRTYSPEDLEVFPEKSVTVELQYENLYKEG